MFADILLQLCEKNGEKYSTLLRKLGYSASSFEKWKNGATVNSGILLDLSKHFDVSVDYLLTGKEFSPSKEDPRDSITDDELEMIKMYRALPEAVQEVAYSSIKTGYDAEMRRIAEERRLLG